MTELDKTSPDSVLNRQLMPPDPIPTKSFASVISASPKKFEIPLKEVGSYKGEPLIQFSMKDIKQLAEPFKYTIVGKFTHGKPEIAVIRKLFGKLELKANCNIGILDHKHVLVLVLFRIR